MLTLLNFPDIFSCLLSISYFETETHDFKIETLVSQVDGFLESVVFLVDNLHALSGIVFMLDRIPVFTLVRVNALANGMVLESVFGLEGGATAAAGGVHQLCFLRGAAVVPDVVVGRLHLETHLHNFRRLMVHLLQAVYVLVK